MHEPQVYNIQSRPYSKPVTNFLQAPIVPRLEALKNRIKKNMDCTCSHSNPADLKMPSNIIPLEYRPQIVQYFYDKPRGLCTRHYSMKLSSNSGNLSSNNDRCVPNPLPCDHTTPYRTYNGWCNNLRFPHYGNTFNPFRRLIDPAYNDGKNSPQTSRFVHCLYFSLYVYPNYCLVMSDVY